VKLGDRAVRYSVVGLFALACIYTLAIGSNFFIPLTLAMLLHLVFRPFLRFLEKLGLSPPIAAAFILSMIVAILVIAVAYLVDPINNWFRDMPRIVDQLQEKVQVLRKPIETVSNASEQVEKIAQAETQGNKETVVIKTPGIVERLAATIPIAGVQVLSTLILLYFFLSYSGEMRTRVLQTMGRSDRKDLVDLLSRVERELSRYLATITAINVVLGMVIGAGLFFIGMPTPYVWGVMATLLNFVPYLGSLAGAVIVTLVALLSFDDAVYALLAPAIYLVATTIEGQFVTPAIVGNRLLVSPMVIFVGIVFWAWLWGPLGALLAVPLMIVLKISADRIPGMRGLGHIIGRDAPMSGNDPEQSPASPKPS
tara:strand:- start:1186 stop:2289 length:1104 start_codon:yes stop_codon:yes gene_type:complete